MSIAAHRRKASADYADIKSDSRVRSTSPENEQIELINHSLDIDALFWDRDSHGLFDYEFKHLKSASITAIGCS